MNENTKERTESDILFSKAVKAAKRIYYIDVKQDRHKELYLSITESKRVKEGSEDARPVFEKHKIFLYREDIDKFMAAFDAAAQFTRENGSSDIRHPQAESSDFYSESQLSDKEKANPADDNEETNLGTMRKMLNDFRLDIDF